MLNNKFIKNVLGFSIPTWIGFIISFLATPIITRLFLPEEIGKINLFSTYLNLFMLIAYFGLDQAYVRFYNDLPGKYSKRELFSFVLGSSFFIGLVISIIIMVFNKFFSIQISGVENFLISICLIICLLMNIILKFLNVYSRMERSIFLYAVQAISIVFVSKVFYVVVALWNPTHMNAIFALTLGYILISILFLAIKRNTIVSIKFLDYRSSSELFKFGIPLVPVTLLSWLNNSIAQFMLKAYVNYSAIGIYTNAVSIANTMNLIQAGFNVYWIPFVYSNYKNNSEMIRKVHRYITLLMCFLGISIIFFQDIIYMLLGTEYRSSKNFFPLLLLSPICFTIAETTGIGIGISKKSYLNIISFTINTLTNIVCSFLLLKSIGIEGAALSASFSAVMLLVTKTILGEKYFKCITSYFQTFASILIMFASAIINYIFFYSNLVKYLLLIMLLIILLIINREIVSEIIGFIKKGMNRRKK